LTLSREGNISFPNKNKIKIKKGSWSN